VEKRILKSLTTTSRHVSPPWARKPFSGGCVYRTRKKNVKKSQKIGTRFACTRASRPVRPELGVSGVFTEITSFRLIPKNAHFFSRSPENVPRASGCSHFAKKPRNFRESEKRVKLHGRAWYTWFFCCFFGGLKIYRASGRHEKNQKNTKISTKMPKCHPELRFYHTLHVAPISSVTRRPRPDLTLYPCN
jgi:hypothetical protein